MLKRASRISPRDARPAAMQRRMHRSPREKCSPQFAQTAARNARFLSSLQTTDPYTAANALRQEEESSAEQLSAGAYSLIRLAGWCE